jgi:Pyrimidine dimer DNA glycosylase
MRLWTVHPKYLDARGLVALWREALLARAVLRGKTRGYRHHPQLTRFREQARPVESLNRYLAVVYAEAHSRGYAFDRRKLGRAGADLRIVETRGQLAAEWVHLMCKLQQRAPERYEQLVTIGHPAAHPLFRLVPGRVRAWERRR